MSAMSITCNTIDSRPVQPPGVVVLRVAQAKI